MKWNKKQTTKVILRPQCVCVLLPHNMPAKKWKIPIGGHLPKSLSFPRIPDAAARVSFLPIRGLHAAILDRIVILHFCKTANIIITVLPTMPNWWLFSFCCDEHTASKMLSLLKSKNGQLLNSGSFDCVIFHLPMKWAKLVALIIINTIATTMYVF